MTPNTSSAPEDAESLPDFNRDVLVSAPPQSGEGEHEHGQNWVIRHLSNTLVGRIVEAGVGTTRASATSIACISPWGDNNPVVLPCVRVRDVALMGLMTATGGVAGFAQTLGHSIFPAASSFFVVAGGHIFEVGGQAANDWANDKISGTIFKNTVERAVDSRALKEMLTTTQIISFEISLKHTMSWSSSAELSFFQQPGPSDLSPLPSPALPLPSSSSSSRPSSSLSLSSLSLKDFRTSSYSKLNSIKGFFEDGKGWMSPYLMATQRTPAIPRKETPTAILSHGPFIEADYLFAQHIAAQTAQLISFCEPDPEVDCSFTRLFVGFIGIAPYRGIWAQSRRPEEAKLTVKMANGVPGLILPVLPGAPLTSWDALPLSTLLNIPCPSPAWNLHVASISALLESIIDFSNVSVPSSSAPDLGPAEEEGASEAKAAIRRAVEVLFEGVRLLEPVLKGKRAKGEPELDSDRAGVVLLRFGNRSLFAKEEGGALDWAKKWWKHGDEKEGGEGQGSEGRREEEKEQEQEQKQKEVEEKEGTTEPRVGKLDRAKKWMRGGKEKSSEEGPEEGQRKEMGQDEDTSPRD